MTIAVCYVSHEGIVFGTDSTSTYGDLGGYHYYNHGQKLFEIGEDSTLGIVTWGMGGLPHTSYRTLVALLADSLDAQPAVTVEEVAQRWIDQFWAAYQTHPSVQECAILAAKLPHDPAAPNAQARTAQEEERFAKLKGVLAVGFCLGGYLMPGRNPAAFQMLFEGDKGKPQPVASTNTSFWGAPNFIMRLFTGIDFELRHALLNSGKWQGTPSEFDALAQPFRLAHQIIPLREAVDFVHTCISSTIKALKFSSLSQICGGPIELAVISTDRKFRWVRHKPWDAAITEGDLE